MKATKTNAETNGRVEYNRQMALIYTRDGLELVKKRLFASRRNKVRIHFHLAKIEQLLLEMK